MVNFIKSFFKRFLKPESLDADVLRDIANKLDHIGNNQHNLIDKITQLTERYEITSGQNALNEIRSLPKYDDARNLTRHGYKVFSGNDEDGIIAEIFDRIGTTNKTFVEFGVEDGLENNSLFLLHKGWNGLWFEGNPESYRLIQYNISTFINNNALKVGLEWVAPDNINQNILKYGISGEIDLFIIDVDGNDYHILTELSAVDPRVIVLEYNALFPSNYSWIMEFNKDHRWVASSYYGASLKAFETLLQEKGYSLVGCNITGNNAFFVRNDLLGEKFLPPFTSENHYEPMRYWLHKGFAAERNFSKKVGNFISN